ncbi:MAG: hypothetical protein RLO17_06165 [Cyclobacteriaceae bacterium]|jgi:hypothetical protein|nr:hypothetical protein [Bacteroidota bacterium]|tara:strand:- start:3448 stop:4134 length:687 start_codon:yes stop_codon:yes gene_type:complete
MNKPNSTQIKILKTMNRMNSIIFFTLIMLFTACSKDGEMVETSDTYDVIEPPYKKLTINGEDAPFGIFDPSLEYDDNGIGWMTYSSVSSPTMDHKWVVQTELAKSANRGTTWTKVQTVNEADYETFTIHGEETEGHWNKETSSLLYDNEDPDGQKRWKLFAHRIFSPNEGDEPGAGNLPFYSFISYMTAPEPTGPWSEERFLFGTSKSEVPDLVDIHIDNLALRLRMQ